jgi:hypothetical protein
VPDREDQHHEALVLERDDETVVADAVTPKASEITDEGFTEPARVSAVAR